MVTTYYAAPRNILPQRIAIEMTEINFFPPFSGGDFADCYVSPVKPQDIARDIKVTFSLGDSDRWILLVGGTATLEVFTDEEKRKMERVFQSLRPSVGWHFAKVEQR